MSRGFVSKIIITASASIILAFTTGCGLAWQVVLEGNNPPRTTRSASTSTPAPEGKGKGYKVPPGHMPPPGKCRIWYPDRPPGHQPPPGDCEYFRKRVPPGAYLIEG